MGVGTGSLRALVAVLVTLLTAVLVAGCTSDDSTGERSGEPQAPPRPANLAFIDVGASRAVLDQITPAVARFFSYDFRHLDQHTSQLMADSTARFWSELEPSLELVRDVALRKQIIATAKVVATSLRVLEPSRAELLLFVNRSTTEAGAPPQSEGSSVLVSAARVGPTWKIDGIKVL